MTALPDTCTLYAGANNFTFKVSNFSESGGESKVTFIKTMGRNHKRFRSSYSDFNIDLDVYSDDASFINTVGSYNSVGSIVLTYLGSPLEPNYTLSYYNCYAVKFNQTMDSEEYLKGTLSFSLPYFDTTGSFNRVGSP